MFCPKCGTQNPANGKFCRACGTDLGTVSAALTGSLKLPEPSVGRKRGPSWESAIGKLFTGLAFLIVSLILGYTGAAGAQLWWFWLLIPAFGAMGSGVAQIVQLKKYDRSPMISPVIQPSMPAAQPHSELPPPQTDFIPPQKSFYDDGEYVPQPPSVTEPTTRHLEANSEGETMTLPKKGD